MDILINVWDNLYPAIIGGVLTWIYTKLKSYIERKKVEKKFFYGNKYITKFEDLVNGEKVVSIAPAVLEQRGGKISGSTILGDRSWILNGHITKMGYLYGEYYAERESDGGFGNFFLEATDNGDLEGLWSGFDSRNNEICSGRYTFMKVTDCFIENLDEKDVNICIDIVDSVLGRDYIDAENFSMMLEDSKFICLKAKHKGKVIGVAIGGIMDIEDAIKYLKLSVDDVPNVMKPCKQIGIIKTIAIAQKYWGRGIASKLVEDLEGRFYGDGIHLITCVAWCHDNIENIGGIMRRYNYREQMYIENYWEKESIEKGFVCPVCGDNGCFCSAKIYTKAI